MATALMNSMNNLSIHGNHNQSNHVHNSNGTNNNMIGGNNNNSNNNGKSSLFVGDLSIFCSEQDLEKAFSPFGTLLEIKIMRSEETSRNLSYGFIKFAAPNSAKMAMDQLNGVMLCGRQMRIRWASYRNKTTNQKDGGRNDDLETSPVHVSFISYQIDKLVTEESLRVLYNQFGKVIDVSIKKSMIDSDIGRQSGYGFVHYDISREGIQAALDSAESLQDKTIDEVNYKSSVSHSLNKYLTGEESLPLSTLTPTPQPPTNSYYSNPLPQQQPHHEQQQQQQQQHNAPVYSSYYSTVPPDSNGGGSYHEHLPAPPSSNQHNQYHSQNDHYGVNGGMHSQRSHANPPQSVHDQQHAQNNMRSRGLLTVETGGPYPNGVHSNGLQQQPPNRNPNGPPMNMSYNQPPSQHMSHGPSPSSNNHQAPGSRQMYINNAPPQQMQQQPRNPYHSAPQQNVVMQQHQSGPQHNHQQQQMHQQQMHQQSMHQQHHQGPPPSNTVYIHQNGMMMSGPQMNVMMDPMKNNGYPSHVMQQSNGQHQSMMHNQMVVSAGGSNMPGHYQQQGISQNGMQNMMPPQSGGPNMVPQMNGGMQSIPVIYQPVSPPGAIAMSPMPIAGYINSSPTMPMHVITAAPPWTVSPPMMSPISAVSTDSIREEQLSYLNHLLSPGGSSTMQGFAPSPIVAINSPMVTYAPGPLLQPYGMTMGIWNNPANNNQNHNGPNNQHGPVNINNNRPMNKVNQPNGRIPQISSNDPDTPRSNNGDNNINNGKAVPSSPSEHQNSAPVAAPAAPVDQRNSTVSTPPSNPATTFNSDVIMTSAVARNNKIATKSGPSSRSLSNRTRKFLNLETKKDSNPLDDEIQEE